MRILGLVATLSLPLVVAACGDGRPAVGTSGTIALSSPAFGPLAPIPKKYARRGEGENVSPPLEWTKVPAGTKELVVFMDDPDAQEGTWTHWVVYGIPPTAKGLPEGVPPEPAVMKVPEGAMQGMNSWNEIGYGGPFPPVGSKHKYAFWVYALDARLPLGVGATRTEVMAAMKGHILGNGRFLATYGR